jgi:hypothetical protein
VTFKEANDRLYGIGFNTSNRLPEVLDLAERMTYESWLRLLGEHWSGFDHITDYKLELFGLTDGVRPAKQMMDHKEWAAFEKLPDTITVYRGCGEHNKFGLCWSLDKRVAERFPFLNRHTAKTPLLVTAVAQKEDILALKLDREEQEVITFDPEIISVEPIPVPMFAEAAQ